MSETLMPFDGAAVETAGEKKAKRESSTLTRVAKYSFVRIVALFLTVTIGVYLTVLIANMGGYVDEIKRGAIRERVGLAISMDPNLQQYSTEERSELIDRRVALEEERLGLNQPFFIRSFRYLSNAMTLSLGRSENIVSDTGSKEVRTIILDRLPVTLVLFATGNLLLFFASLFGALSLSRKYGSFLDKLVVGSAPISAAPGWFYGLFLILIFAAIFRILPFGGMMDAPVPESPIRYSLSLAKHLVLPVTAILISGIFGGIYNWRTFFLIYSSEDYVELAKAKGLPDKMVERRYILRPTLPTIITSFALTLIYLWSGAIILETVFNWPGLGRLYFAAIGIYDTPVIVALTVIFAYLLALTVFLLDFIYALVDPRVKVGNEGGSRA